MKHLAITTICIFCLCAAVNAETTYITGTIKITLRTGPGIDYKIITQIKSDTEVKKIESGLEKSVKDWSFVRLPDGKEGWVLNRFTTSAKPSRILLKELQTKYNIITKKYNIITKKLTEVTDAYETLKTESADFLTLKAKFKKTSSHLAKQTTKAEAVEQELSTLAMNHNIRWFITGAVVLLIGVIIGYSSKRQKRRTSLL